MVLTSKSMNVFAVNVCLSRFEGGNKNNISINRFKVCIAVGMHIPHSSRGVGVHIAHSRGECTFHIVRKLGMHYAHSTEFRHITSGMVLKTLQDTVTLLGPESIGVPVRLVGTHSVRISFAMLLVLCGAPDSLIKQKGRWKSDAFLRYIRTYVNKYGNESSAMIANETTGNFKSLSFI